MGCNQEDILRCSAKDGIGTEDVLEAVVDRIPPPRESEGGARGLIFDSFYDHFNFLFIYLYTL